MNNLIKHYEILQPMLCHLGDIYFAGGCVRDFHLNKTPRDYDLFIVNSYHTCNILRRQLNNRQRFSLPKAEKLVRSSSKYVVKNIDINGEIIQVLWSQCKTIEELMESFDWNICNFAYGTKSMLESSTLDARFYHKETAHDMMIANKTLKLQKPGEIPASTLRRGFIFSERYDMFIDKRDLYKLCEMQIALQNARDVEEMVKI